jgi:hypothetical protein
MFALLTLLFGHKLLAKFAQRGWAIALLGGFAPWVGLFAQGCEVRTHEQVVVANVQAWVETYSVDFFRDETPCWQSLEGVVSQRAATSRTFRVMLFYQYEASVPTVADFLPELDTENPNPEALMPLMDQLGRNCVLLYVQMGRQGAMLQWPEQKRAELEELIGQLAGQR